MPADFPAEQRRVAFRMGAAVAITVTAFAVTLPLTAGTPLPPIERLAMAIRLDLFVALWLAIAIGDVARRRFLSPDDIAGSGTGASTPGLAPASAFLSNTTEQVLLALPVHAALALALPRPLPVIAVLVTLFGIGRLLFRIGYAHGASARAFGFALTFYPTVAGLIIALWKLNGG